MDLQMLLDKFGAKDEGELLAKKQADKQQKVFALKKPTPIALTAEQCQKMCEKNGLSYLPGYEHRVLQYIVTNETCDRYGDIVRAAGGNFTNYSNNAVIFYSHNYSTPPIGNSLKVWVDKQAKNVQAWGLFLDDSVDKTGLSDLVFRMAVSGFMKACSVGFQPIKANSPQSPEERQKLGLGKWGVEYTQWDMLEWSPCGIPANPTALQNTFKDIQGALSLEQHHIDAAAKFQLFEGVNLLDQFAEIVGRKVGKVFSLPTMGSELIKTLGIKVDAAAGVTDPLTDADFNIRIIPNEGADDGLRGQEETKTTLTTETNNATIIGANGKELETPAPATIAPEVPASTLEEKVSSPVVVNLDLSAFVNAINEIKTIAAGIVAAFEEIKSVQTEIKSAVELIKQHNANAAQTDRKSLYTEIVPKVSLFERPKF
jgi:phage head maturation protease